MLKVWENISYIYIYIVIILEILSLLIVYPEVAATEKRITICQSTEKSPTNSHNGVETVSPEVFSYFSISWCYPNPSRACLSLKTDGFTLGYELNPGEVIMTISHKEECSV